MILSVKPINSHIFVRLIESYILIIIILYKKLSMKHSLVKAKMFQNIETQEIIKHGH